MTKIYLKSGYLNDKDYTDILKPKEDGELNLDHLKEYYQKQNPNLSEEEVEKQIFANTIAFNFVENKNTTKTK